MSALKTRPFAGRYFQHEILPFSVPLVRSARVRKENHGNTGVPIGYSGADLIRSAAPHEHWLGDRRVQFFAADSDLRATGIDWVRVGSTPPLSDSLQKSHAYTLTQNPRMAVVGLHVAIAAVRGARSIAPMGFYVHPDDVVPFVEHSPLHSATSFLADRACIQAALKLAESGKGSLYSSDGFSSFVRFSAGKLTRDEWASVGKHALTDYCDLSDVVEYGRNSASFQYIHYPISLPETREGLRRAGIDIHRGYGVYNPIKNSVVVPSEHMLLRNPKAAASALGLPELALLPKQAELRGNNQAISFPLSIVHSLNFAQKDTLEYQLRLSTTSQIMLRQDSLPGPASAPTSDFILTEVGLGDAYDFDHAVYVIRDAGFNARFMRAVDAHKLYANLPEARKAFHWNAAAMAWIIGEGYFDKEFLSTLKTRDERRHARLGLNDAVLKKHGTIPEKLDGSKHTMADADKHFAILKMVKEGQATPASEIHAALILASGEEITHLFSKPQDIVPEGATVKVSKISGDAYFVPAITLDEYFERHGTWLLELIQPGLGGLVGRMCMNENVPTALALKVITGH